MKQENKYLDYLKTEESCKYFQHCKEPIDDSLCFGEYELCPRWKYFQAMENNTKSWRYYLESRER